jgi:hypothetical protein
MKLSFYQSQLCKRGIVCGRCRSTADPAFRHQQAARFRMEEQDFACPKDHPWDYVPLKVTAKPARKRQRQTPASPSAPPAAVPAEQWPWHVRAIAALRQSGEAGIGDTIHNQLKLGGKPVIALALKMLGINCGCSDRQAWLNARYPYPDSSSGC